MERLRFELTAVLAVATIPSVAFADRGYIRVEVPINVSEPAQRAIIGHNGTHELLILQTEVKASRNAKIVEFMPLPAKPEVTVAPQSCFRVLGELLDKHGVRYIKRRPRKRNGGDNGGEGEAIRVVVSKQIGPHDITVVEVKDADAFVKWTRDFFQQRKLGKPAVAGDLREIVADYLQREIRFFAFDVISVTRKKKTIQPIAYAFPSETLYYPLKVTNLYGGKGVVELFLVTPSDVGVGSVYISGASHGASVSSTTAELSADELGLLHPELAKLTRGGPATLRAHRYQGKLRFAKDLGVCTGYKQPEALARAFLHALESGDMAQLTPLVATPFAFDRKELFVERTKLRAIFAQILTETRGKSLDVKDSMAIAVDTSAPALTPSSTSQIILDKYKFGPGNPDHDFVREAFPGQQLHLVWLEIGDELIMVIVGQAECDALLYRVVGFSD